MHEGGFRQATGRMRGVTLIELMVTLAVLAVLLAIGVPSFSRLMASNRVASQTNDLIAGLNLARAEAVRRAQPVALRTAGSGEDFSSGWKVFTDANADGDDSDGTVVRQLSVPAGAGSVKRVVRSGSLGSYSYADAGTSMADRSYVIFNSRGAKEDGTASFFRICHGSVGSVKGRIVQVSATGRISLESSNESCS